MKVKSMVEECSLWSILLQYFRPSLSYHLSLRSLFCLFLSGRLRQVLLVVCFVALRPESTAMVLAGRSVQLATLFPGQA